MQYFVPAARTCASPLLRAGATLSEAEYLQKFATAAQMKAVEAPVQNIDVETAVKTANRIFVDLRPPAEVAITGKSQHPFWRLTRAHQPPQPLSWPLFQRPLSSEALLRPTPVCFVQGLACGAGKIKGALSMPLYTRLQELAQELKDRDAMYVVYAGASTPDKCASPSCS